VDSCHRCGPVVLPSSLQDEWNTQERIKIADTIMVWFFIKFDIRVILNIVFLYKVKAVFKLPNPLRGHFLKGCCYMRNPGKGDLYRD